MQAVGVKGSTISAWRALALLAPSGDRLLCVGDTSNHVVGSYGEAFEEVLCDEDRGRVKCISLQRWAGTNRAGQWVHESFLQLPTSPK